MRALSAIGIAIVLLCGCSKKEEATGNSSGNPLTAPVDYLGSVAQSKKGAESTLDSAGLNKAIEMFNVQEGRYPNDLNELAQKRYIPAVPAPPHGMKFDYDAKAGTVKVVPQ